MDITGRTVQGYSGTGDAGAPARIPKSLYTIRGNRIMRADDNDPPSPVADNVKPVKAKIIGKSPNKTIKAKPVTSSVKGVINARYVTIGLTLGLVGLAVLVMVMNGASNNSPVVTQSAAEIGDEQTVYTVENNYQSKQPSTGVLGATSQVGVGQQQVTAPEQLNGPRVKASVSPNPVTPALPVPAVLTPPQPTQTPAESEVAPVTVPGPPQEEPSVEPVPPEAVTVEPQPIE